MLVWVHCHRGKASGCKNPQYLIFTKLHGTWNFLTSLTLRNSHGSSVISYISLVSALSSLRHIPFTVNVNFVKSNTLSSLYVSSLTYYTEQLSAEKLLNQ